MPPVFRTTCLRLLSLLFPLVLAGCAQMNLLQQNRGQPLLDAGVRQYEDGNYKEAAKSLQGALDAGLADDENRILARKHLAFMHCAAGRKDPCRDEFRRILAIEPKFDLKPAEAGHPAWGPVFRALRTDAAPTPKR
jgi:Tfp pilus assembly protein PilF